MKVGEMGVKYLLDFILAVSLNGFSYYIASVILRNELALWQAKL